MKHTSRRFINRTVGRDRAVRYSNQRVISKDNNTLVKKETHNKTCLSSFQFSCPVIICSRNLTLYSHFNNCLHLKMAFFCLNVFSCLHLLSISFFSLLSIGLGNMLRCCFAKQMLQNMFLTAPCV